MGMKTGNGKTRVVIAGEIRAKKRKRKTMGKRGREEKRSKERGNGTNMNIKNEEGGGRKKVERGTEVQRKGRATQGRSR